MIDESLTGLDMEEENMENEFRDWYYNLESCEYTELWNEMSFRRYNKDTHWEHLQPTEFESYELNGSF